MAAPTLLVKACLRPARFRPINLEESRSRGMRHDLFWLASKMPAIMSVIDHPKGSKMKAAYICLIGLLLSGAVSVESADAKPARCFSTDDGYFDCDFQATDRDGSFTIEGPAVSYSLIIERPGFASAFVNLGQRNISLPGLYVRQRTDPACWANPETETKICAW